MGADALVERWKWHHLVATRDGANVRILLDGKSMETTLASVSDASSPDTFFFGGSCTGDGDGNFEGRLDEIAVFDRALSKEGIATLYQERQP